MKTPLNVVAGSPHTGILKLLMANGAELKANWNGSFITHEAVIWRQPGMLEFILSDLKIEPDLKARNGATALHYAINLLVAGQVERNEPLLASIKLLMKHGANPNLRFRNNNNNNRSAVELAMSKGMADVVTLLNRR